MDDNFEPNVINSPEELTDLESVIESDEEGSLSEEENFSELEEEEESGEYNQQTNNSFDNEINLESEEEESEEEENYQKFDNELKKNFILDEHPEIISHNNHEIQTLSKITRNKDGIIIDSLHKTLPFLTKYERTKILGVRAKQINEGCDVFIDVPSNIIDGYTIAEMELKEKKIPFIIRRPLPNGSFEYWKVQDLEHISY
jgi:DNA-directed RNA polymerase I, II, and III subunit RPABC2